MSGLKIVTFLVGHREPHEDSLRAGCGPQARCCAPLLYSIHVQAMELSIV